MAISFLRRARGLGSSLQIPFLGGFVVLVSFLSYHAIVSSFSVLSVQSLKFLEMFAFVTFILVVAGLAVSSYGLHHILRAERLRMRVREDRYSSTLSLLAGILSEKMYSRIFTLAALVYGFFYSFISSTIVYQPWVRFSDAYLAKIPSVLVVACCGSIGQVPRVIVYLTEHLGLLITPINLVLLFLVSGLVGLNVSLAIFSYKHLSTNSNTKWLSVVGSSLSFFTSCPACAGLFFAAAVGGTGAVSLATGLASLQIPFVFTAVPVLMLTPMLTSRNLLKTLSSKCTSDNGNRIKVKHGTGLASSESH